MTAKEFLHTIADSNDGSTRKIAEDVRDSLPADFDLKFEVRRVISEFFGDHALQPDDPRGPGSMMERSRNVMLITNFITLNGERITEVDC